MKAGWLGSAALAGGAFGTLTLIERESANAAWLVALLVGAGLIVLLLLRRQDK